MRHHFKYHIKWSDISHNSHSVLSKRSLMALKLFQCTQRLCDVMGFLPSHQNPTHLHVQWKILLYLLPPISYFISSVIFLLTIANSIQDITLSILMSTSILTCVSYIAVMIWNMPGILKVIETFEKTIEKSECNKWKTRNRILSKKKIN